MSWTKYLSIAKLEMSNNLTYAGDVVARGIFIAAILFIFYNLWSTIYRSSASTVLSGFTLSGILWYLVLSESVVAGGRGRSMAFFLSDDIKSGNIAQVLNKPYDFVAFYFASNIGNSIFIMLMSFMISGAMIYALVGAPHLSIAELPFVALSIFLALVLQFFLYFSIGLCAFWFEDVSAFRWITEKLVFVLGGMLIPLNFFPKIFQTIASILPYSYMSYAPAYLFVNFSLSGAISSMLVQLVWVILLVACAFGLYGLGAKKVSINGG